MRDLQSLIQELAEAKRAYDRLVFDEQQPHELGPPASPDQIAKLEKILRRRLPPSYHAFLELHNGWSDFDGGSKLLATEDQEAQWVKERIKYWSDLIEDDTENPFQQGAIPVLLGEDENHFLVLDPRSAQENGEMDFVDYDYGQEHRRFKDFTSFLENSLKITQALIDRETKGSTDEEIEEDENG